MNEPSPAETKAEVLIVDDNPQNLTLLSGMLAEEGYRVRAALSGALALGAVAAAPPDLILLDISMPGLSGYDVCRRLKADKKTAALPIIFISALDAIGDKVAAFEMGGVDYVTKPFQTREVLSRVSTHLTLQRQRKEIERQREEIADRYQQIQQLQAVLKSYMSNRAWESVVSSAAAAPPAREPLTILITDIEGFVGISERAEPVALFADLGRYMTLLTNAVYDCRGEVDSCAGDRMLAFFKEPQSALRAAYSIQARVADFNTGRASAGAPAFPTRLGLGTGLVAIGTTRCGHRRELTLVGESVRMAERLQAEARAGSILMDEATFQACRPEGAVCSERSLKGNPAPVPVHELGADVIARPLL